MTEVATSSTEPKPSTEETKNEETTKDEITKDEIQKEITLLADGKRNLLCGEIPTAVNQLQEACRLLAAKYGDLDDRCGEAYLCYGTALLDLSRMESGVLGNALQGIEGEESEEASGTSDDKVEDPEACTGEEREKVSNEVIDAMLETDEELAARQKKEKEEGKVNGQEAETKTDDAKTEEKTEEKMEEGKEEKEEKMEEGKEEKKEEGKEEKEEKMEEGKEEKKEEKKDEEKEEKMEEEKETKAEEKKDGEKVEKAKEKEGAEKKADEAMETDEKKDSEEKTEDEGTEAESEDVGTEGDTAEEGDTADDEAEGTADDEAGEKKEEEDDVSNLQLAWEILELAKVIYSKHDSKEMKLKAAEAYLKLGEVGLETEQYEQAIGDLKECLKIQKEHLEPESRLIAETHYQIGLACSFSAKHDEALTEFRQAVKTIETKIGKLKEIIEAADEKSKGKEPASLDDPVVQAQKEVKDLQEILPDILAKIEDTDDEKRNQDRVKELVKENVASDLGTTTFGEASSKKEETKEKEAEPATKNVSDITHLVRKKRKPEDESPETEDSKKAKTENGSGDAPKEVNGKPAEITT